MTKVTTLPDSFREILHSITQLQTRVAETFGDSVQCKVELTGLPFSIICAYAEEFGEVDTDDGHIEDLCIIEGKGDSPDRIYFENRSILLDSHSY